LLVLIFNTSSSFCHLWFCFLKVEGEGRFPHWHLCQQVEQEEMAFKEDKITSLSWVLWWPGVQLVHMEECFRRCYIGTLLDVLQDGHWKFEKPASHRHVIRYVNGVQLNKKLTTGSSVFVPYWLTDQGITLSMIHTVTFFIAAVVKMWWTLRNYWYVISHTFNPACLLPTSHLFTCTPWTLWMKYSI
jgi:hypothetical protein